MKKLVKFYQNDYWPGAPSKIIGGVLNALDFAGVL